MAKLEDSRTKTSPAGNEGNNAKEKKSLSKRQRRKQINNKHKWPEVPKIKSPEVRAKAYIRIAGLAESSDKKNSVDLDDPSVRFGRLLGSADQRTRHQAVLALESYLKQKCEIFDDDEKNMNQPGMSELDMLKLWKALWHTLYMADKVPVQHELSRRLAKLIWCFAGTEEEDEYAGRVYLETYCFNDLDVEEEKGEDNDMMQDEDEGEEEEESVTMEEIENTLRAEFDQDESEQDEEMEEEEDDFDDEAEEQMEEEAGLENMDIPHCRGAHLSSLFVRTFLHTVRREWGQMDKYRVDKFYTLMRMMIHEVYRYMSLRHWSRGIVRTFNDVLHEEVLSQTPNGLRYHLIDLAVHELALVNAKAPMSLTETTFLDCMEPFFALAAISVGDDTVRVRVMDNVVAKFLDYSVVSARPVKDEEGSALQFDQVHVGSLADYIFQLASDPETSDGHREALYDVQKDYMRAIKKAGKDVVLGMGQNDEDSEEDHAFVRPDELPEQEVDELDDNQKDAVTRNRLHAKKEHNSDAAIDSDALYDGDVDTPERPRKRKNLGKEGAVQETKSLSDKDGTKKKRNRKTEGRSSEEMGTAESPDATDVNSPILGGKKNRRKPKEGDRDQQTMADSAHGHGDLVDSMKPKGKKMLLDSPEGSEWNIGRSDRKNKKKRRKDTTFESGDRSSLIAPREAEEITISISEQRKARKALTRQSKQGAAEKEIDSTPSSERKRVKFGQHVMARSWVNSMAGLHNMQVSPLPPKPKKGILQEKRSDSKVTKVKSQRKKASDYF